MMQPQYLLFAPSDTTYTFDLWLPAHDECFRHRRQTTVGSSLSRWNMFHPHRNVLLHQSMSIGRATILPLAQHSKLYLRFSVAQLCYRSSYVTLGKKAIGVFNKLSTNWNWSFILETFLCLFAESPPERSGRRRSMPGSSSDKNPPTMEATSTAATPFRVTVSTVSVFLCIVHAVFCANEIWFL